MVAVKNKCQDGILSLPENPNAGTGSSGTNSTESALVVASTLASQPISQLNDGPHNNPQHDWSETPLFWWAVQCGHEAVVQLLLVDHRVNIREKFDGFWFPDCDIQHFGQGNPREPKRALDYAAYSGCQGVVRVLLKNGADIQAEDDKWTAFYYAAYYGQKAVVRLLLEHGANIEAKDKKGQTALDVET